MALILTAKKHLCIQGKSALLSFVTSGLVQQDKVVCSLVILYSLLYLASM